MKSGWKNYDKFQSKRHSNAVKYGRAGGRYAGMKPKKRFLSAPLSSKSIKLPIQFSVNVPSTEYSEKISPADFRKRVEETAKEFSSKFGGDTSVKGKGDYTSKGQLIREDVVIIESSMSKEDYAKKKVEIENFIKDKQKEWKQETIGYTFEDDFYLYPKN